MKTIYKYNILIYTALALALLTSCQRTELCYDHYPRASMDFSWEQEWERDYGMAHSQKWDNDYYGFDYDHLRPDIPEWVNLVKYSNSNSAGEHYLSPSGGDVLLQEDGTHSFLFYNGDTEYIVLSDMASLSDARASSTSRSRATLSYIMERHPGSRSCNSPDILYAAYFENIPSLKVHENLPLHVKMQPLVYTYIIRYEFEYGIESVHLARGALGGMAESVYMRDGRTSDESAIILYDCDVTDSGCEAHVRSFGIPGFPDEYYGRSADSESERPYTLNLEVLLKNGKTKEFNFDVADQIKNQPRGGVIVVTGLRVEDDENSTTAGGFDVDLSGWGEVDVDFPLSPN